jgi:hypothetical protein
VATGPLRKTGGARRCGNCKTTVATDCTLSLLDENHRGRRVTLIAAGTGSGT